MGYIKPNDLRSNWVVGGWVSKVCRLSNRCRIRDSLQSKSNKEEALEQRTKHEYEKKKALDDVENEKKIAIQVTQNEKQKIITYSIFGGLILVVLFLIFVY